MRANTEITPFEETCRAILAGHLSNAKPSMSERTDGSAAALLQVAKSAREKADKWSAQEREALARLRQPLIAAIKMYRRVFKNVTPHLLPTLPQESDLLVMAEKLDDFGRFGFNHSKWGAEGGFDVVMSLRYLQADGAAAMRADAKSVRAKLTSPKAPPRQRTASTAG